MSRSILKKGDPLLNRPSEEVRDFSALPPLLDDLWKTLTDIKGLYNFARGIGVSAVQIGQALRVCVVDYGGTRYELINAVIVRHSPNQVSNREGCLSFFDERGQALRHASIAVRAQNRHAQWFELIADGDFAGPLQHELDHQDGQLYDEVLVPGSSLYVVPGMPTIP